MLLSYRGFHEVLIPEVTFYEMKTGGSHDYELPDDIFSRFDDMLVVTKMHVYGSEHNARLLRDAGVKYVVLYRDLRDVAVSHYFYVRKTPWHPEYPIYRPLSPEEGLLMFADRSLDDFAEWVRLWDRNRDRDLSISVRYEDMLADTTAVMRSVAEHFELDASSDTIKRIVEAHSFQRMARGREPGEQDSNSFVRKGVAGDWKNWFTHEIKQEFKDKIGEFLIEYGYETDHVW